MDTSSTFRIKPRFGRILALADLHWDFWNEDGRDPLLFAKPLLETVDAIIIAGDMTNKPKVRWKLALRYLKRYFPADCIFVIPGNHDYYQFRIDDDERLKQFAEEEGVSFVQNSEILAGGTRFLCTTLWTDLQLAPTYYHVDTVFHKMNDYKHIRVASQAYRRCLPKDTQAQHRQHLNFLKQALGRPFGGETVIVTHHAPIPEASEDELGCFYASDLRYLMEEFAPKAWYYGHTHDPLQITVGKTHVQNVSLGYPEQLSDKEIFERISNSIVSYNPLLA